MDETYPARLEPKGCTMADLMALTLGAAIATSLYWYSNQPGSFRIAGRPAPAGYVWSYIALEFIQKCCVALTPVILQRRWRSGGPLRPIEWLPILVAFGQITLSMWTWPFFGILYDDTKVSSGKLVNMDAFRVWKLTQLALGIGVGVVSAILVGARRKRPSQWFMGFLILLAWDRLIYAGSILYQNWGNQLITSQGWQLSTIRILSATIVQAPIGIVAYLPLAIVLVDLRRAPWRHWSWVGWAAASLGLTLPLLIELRYLAQGVLATKFIDFDHATHLGTWAASIGLAYLLARAFEPAWRWCLDGPERPSASPVT